MHRNDIYTLLTNNYKMASYPIHETVCQKFGKCNFDKDKQL